MTTAATGYEALLGELDTFMKAMPSGAPDMSMVRKDKDGKPMLDADGRHVMRQPRMDADGKPMMKADGSAMMEDDKDEDDTAKSRSFGKSFLVKDQDGNEVEVIDAADMMKALHDENKGLGNSVGKLEKALSSTLTLNMTLGRTVKEQGELIKSLQAKVTEIGGQPRGRATVLNVHEKPDMSVKQAEPEGVRPHAFMDSMMKAFKASAVTGEEVSLAEHFLGAGQQPPASIVSRVMKFADK